MHLNRRRLLRYAPPFLLASLMPSFTSPAMGAKSRFRIGLLVPKTGSYAALGRSMERAAMLAQSAQDAKTIEIFDTGGTPDGAQNAASAARKRGVDIILGPLLGTQVPAVVQAMRGETPIITFTNDMNLHESGAFVMGITARQTVANILQYATSRGIRRVAVGGGTEAGSWGEQVRNAAAIESAAHGLAVTQLNDIALEAIPNVIANSPDRLPDAVLWSDPDGLLRVLPSLRDQGIQALAAFPELDEAPDALAQLAGTWMAAPDPEAFTRFSRMFEQRMGTRPGLIAALAFDASAAIRTMRMGGGLDRPAVLASTGFDGVCGRVRFREDGSASRELAILDITTNGVRKVAPLA